MDWLRSYLFEDIIESIDTFCNNASLFPPHLYSRSIEPLCSHFLDNALSHFLCSTNINARNVYQLLNTIFSWIKYTYHSLQTTYRFKRLKLNFWTHPSCNDVFTLSDINNISVGNLLEKTQKTLLTLES